MRVRTRLGRAGKQQTNLYFSKLPRGIYIMTLCEPGFQNLVEIFFQSKSNVSTLLDHFNLEMAPRHNGSLRLACGRKREREKERESMCAQREGEKETESVRAQGDRDFLSV